MTLDSTVPSILQLRFLGFYPFLYPIFLTPVSCKFRRGLLEEVDGLRFLKEKDRIRDRGELVWEAVEEHHRFGFSDRNSRIVSPGGGPIARPEGRNCGEEGGVSRSPLVALRLPRRPKSP